MKSFYKIELDTLRAHVESVMVDKGQVIATFSDTIFYPGGGGQPCDTGYITGDSFEGDVVLADDFNGTIMHTMKPRHGTLKVGDMVTMHLNRERRDRLVRMHTGEHLFFKSLQTHCPQILLDKIDLGEEESKLFILGTGVTWSEIFEAEKLVNRIISENRQISEKEYPKEEAIKLAGLRIKPERIPGDTVRVISVKDFDLSACRGVHAHTTGFVKNVFITGFNKNAKGFEVRFTTGSMDAALEHAAVARLAADSLKTNVSNVLPFIGKLHSEIADLKDRFRVISAKSASQLTRETLGLTTLAWNLTTHVEKKQLSDAAIDAAKESDVAVIINAEDSSNIVVIATRSGSGRDANVLLKLALSHFDGKGGGRDLMAQGSFSGDARQFISFIKEHLKKS